MLSRQLINRTAERLRTKPSAESANVEHQDWTTAGFLALAAITLGIGLVFAIAPEAIVTMLVFLLALAFTLLGLASLGWTAWFTERRIATAVIVGLAVQFTLMLIIPPEFLLELDDPIQGVPLVGGAFIAGPIALSLILKPSRRALNARFIVLVVAHVLMGVWLIHASPHPLIDVHVFQQQGAATLLHGQNPYAIRNYPDIYGPGSAFYAPGLVVDGHLTFGFSYPPLSLLMALPGYLFGGDFRYSQLVATELAAVFMATARPGRLATAAALIFLFTPRTFFVLEQGWTEPYAVMLLAATLFLAVRAERFTVVSLGLLVAVKQDMLLIWPLALIFLGQDARSRWRLGWQSAAIALAVSLPMILWSVPDFVRSAVLLHVEQPFRPDSLSFLAWFSHDGHAALPTWIAFASVIPVTILAAWRLPRTPSALAASVAIVYFVFFVLSKQAFVQYYYFVIGALCCAVAVAIPQITPNRRRVIEA